MNKLQLLTMSAVLAVGAQANAEDYAYLFDPATMEVGQTVGEFLVVNERCPKPNETTCPGVGKLKYVTGAPGRAGRLEIPVNAGSDFEISFNIYSSNGESNNLTITLYLSDGNSLALDINIAYRATGVSYPNGRSDMNWKAGVNDFRLISEQGNLKISANDTLVDLGEVKLILSGTITRIVMSKIDESEEQLFEIRTRGIQKGGSTSCPTTPPAVDCSTSCPTTPPAVDCSTSCPTTPIISTISSGDCVANYIPDNGRLIVPCTAVPVMLPFSILQVLNYSIEMQQQTGSFTFDLDLNKIVQK